MKNESITFIIKDIAPSENHALLTARGGRRFPSKEYKAWKELVSKIRPRKIMDTQWYGVEIAYYTPLYYKNGNVRRWDAHNYNKYTIDEVIRKLNDGEIDDCRILEHSACKIDSPEKRTEITFYCIGD